MNKADSTLTLTRKEVIDKLGKTRGFLIPLGSNEDIRNELEEAIYQLGRAEESLSTLTISHVNKIGQDLLVPERLAVEVAETLAKSFLDIYLESFPESAKRELDTSERTASVSEKIADFYFEGLLELFRGRCRVTHQTNAPSPPGLVLI